MTSLFSVTDLGGGGATYTFCERNLNRHIHHPGQLPKPCYQQLEATVHLPCQTVYEDEQFVCPGTEQLMNSASKRHHIFLNERSWLHHILTQELIYLEETKCRDEEHLPVFQESKTATTESKGTAFEEHRLFTYK